MTICCNFQTADGFTVPAASFSIHPFSLYNEASIQLGDKAFYTLKESDFPQASTHTQQEATNKSPLSEASADETGESAKEQPEVKRSKQSKRRKKSSRRGKDAEEKAKEEMVSDHDMLHSANFFVRFLTELILLQLLKGLENIN